MIPQSSLEIEEKIREELFQAYQSGDMDSFNELCSILGDLLEERNDPEQRWCRLKYGLANGKNLISVSPRLVSIRLKRDNGSKTNNKRILCFEKGILLTKKDYLDNYNELPEGIFDLHIYPSQGRGIISVWTPGISEFDFDLLLP